MFVIIKEEHRVDGGSEMRGAYGPFKSIDDPEIGKGLIEAGYTIKKDKIEAETWYFKSLNDPAIARKCIIILEVRPAFSKIPERTENNLI